LVNGNYNGSRGTVKIAGPLIYEILKVTRALKEECGNEVFLERL
jgi:hypothetical protein